MFFSAILRASEEPDYWVYYSPTGERRNELGEETPSLALVTDRGMKVLDARGGPGLGGITIWEAGKPYPAWTMKFRRRILFKGPVRSTVEVDLDGFKTDRNRYDIRERFSIYANGRYSENSLSIHPAKPSNSIQFSLGFTRTGHDDSFLRYRTRLFRLVGTAEQRRYRRLGRLRSSAKRAAVLKQEPKQRRVVFAVPPNETSTYYSSGTGGAGGTFPVAPTVVNWETKRADPCRPPTLAVRTQIGRTE